MKALVGAFNQEKALVGAFSVIVQPVVGAEAGGCWGRRAVLAHSLMRGLDARRQRRRHHNMLQFVYLGVNSNYQLLRIFWTEVYGLSNYGQI